MVNVNLDQGNVGSYTRKILKMHIKMQNMKIKEMIMIKMMTWNEI